MRARAAVVARSAVGGRTRGDQGEQVAEGDEEHEGADEGHVGARIFVDDLADGAADPGGEVLERGLPQGDLADLEGA
jgi:hypothetical protein